MAMVMVMVMVVLVVLVVLVLVVRGSGCCRRCLLGAGARYARRRRRRRVCPRLSPHTHP